MIILRLFSKLIFLLILGACVTNKEVKEIKLIAFEDNIAKGKSVGEIEGDDCVFHVMGYWLGGSPTMSRALANARKMRKTSLQDALVASNESSDQSLRYLNNVHVKSDGFNFYLLGKQCLVVKGVGYL